MTIDDDLWDMMNSSSSRKPLKQPGSLIFDVNLPKKRPKSKIHIHGLNNESEDFLDLIGRSTKKKRIEDEIQIELNKKKDRPPLGKKIDLMSMSSLLSSQESQLKSQSEVSKKLDRASQANEGERSSDEIQSHNEVETTSQYANQTDNNQGMATEDRGPKGILGASSDSAEVQVNVYPSHNLMLGETLSSEKQIVTEKTGINAQESEEEKKTIPQNNVDGDYNEVNDIEEGPGTTKSLSPDLIDDSEDEPDIIIPSTEIMEQLLSQVRQSHDEVVPSQTHDNSDYSVSTRGDNQGVEEADSNQTRDNTNELTASISKGSPTENISPQLDTENSKAPSKDASPAKATKVPNTKRAKVSLASLCSKTNTSQISHRVGLSKRFRVDSLHNYLAK